MPVPSCYPDPDQRQASSVQRLFLLLRLFFQLLNFVGFRFCEPRYDFFHGWRLLLKYFQSVWHLHPQVAEALLFPNTRHTTAITEFVYLP